MGADSKWSGKMVQVVESSSPQKGVKAMVLTTSLEDGILYLLLDTGGSGSWIPAVYVDREEGNL